MSSRLSMAKVQAALRKSAAPAAAAARSAAPAAAPARAQGSGEIRIIGGQWKRTRLPVPQRPGAGKGVQAAPAAQVLAQPVEQGFAHAVGCGAQARALGHGQAVRFQAPPMMRISPAPLGAAAAGLSLAVAFLPAGAAGAAAAAWALRISALMALVLRVERLMACPPPPR